VLYVHYVLIYVSWSLFPATSLIRARLSLYLVFSSGCLRLLVNRSICVSQLLSFFVNAYQYVSQYVSMSAPRVVLFLLCISVSVTSVPRTSIPISCIWSFGYASPCPVSQCLCISVSLYLTVAVYHFLCISASLYLTIAVSQCLCISVTLNRTVSVSQCLCVSVSLYLSVFVSQ